MSGDARVVARRVLERVERGDAWATLALDGELARGGLDARDRRLATELVYGVLRHQLRLDRALAAHADPKKTPPRVRLALRLAAYQLLFLRVPGYAAVDDAVGAVHQIGGARLAGFANAVLRKLATSGEPALPPEGRARVEAEHSLPGWIVDELERARSPEDALDAVAAGFAAPAHLAVRVNVRRGDRDAVLAALASEGATATAAASIATGIVVDGLGDPSSSASFRAGRWTVQDLGAQRVGEVVAPVAGERILDACAGVGGKSTHLAELTDDRATIDAVDRSATKLALAADSARRLGLTLIRTVVADLISPGEAPGQALAATYERVLLDAPCTGLGVLRRHPEAKWRAAPGDVARLAAVQASLLDALAPRVAPGGALIYSVCTFTRAEGADQIAAFVARHPEFSVERAEQTWPHRDDADAFYLARLRRT